MKMNITMLCRMLIVVVVLQYQLAAQVNIVYVSPQGSDAWSGRLISANETKTDGPVASLQRAIGVVRSLKISKPNQQYRIEMRGGTYFLNQTILIYREDSGSADNPVTITCYQDEKPVISGGMEITKLQTIQNEEITRLLPDNVRGKVFQAKIDGFPYYKLELNNNNERFFELFYKGEPMHLSRYPRNTFLEISDVVYSAKDTIVTFTDPDIGSMKNEKDLYCHGYWAKVWYDDYLKVKNIDIDNRKVSFLPQQSRYGYEKEQRFYFTNVVSKISAPGDFAFDGASKTVYFYPLDAENANHITAPVVANLLKISDASWIQFTGITFEESVSNAVEASSSSHVTFDNCSFRNISSRAIQAYNATYFTIRNSTFKNLGQGGVDVQGGDRKHLSSAHNIVENNEFHDFSRLVRTHTPAIQVAGVGTLVSHNVVYNASYTGIYFEGNDNIIEYNELYNLGFETGIGGAIYTWGNQTYLGNEIRYNYIHDVHGHGGYSFRGVHIDGFVSGVHVHHNIFSACQQGVLLEGGSFNTIENNLFNKCDRAVTIEQVFYADHKGDFDRLSANLRLVASNATLWKATYPFLDKIMKDTVHAPAGNLFKNNIVLGKKWLDTTAKDSSIILQDGNFISEDYAIANEKFKVNVSLLPESLRSVFTQIDFANIGRKGN